MDPGTTCDGEQPRTVPLDRFAVTRNHVRFAVTRNVARFAVARKRPLSNLRHREERSCFPYSQRLCLSMSNCGTKNRPPQWDRWITGFHGSPPGSVRSHSGFERDPLRQGRNVPSSRCAPGHISLSGMKKKQVPRLPMVARDRHASSHVWLTIPPPPGFL